jgi:DNA-binding winged helix-turn-helix (wHTH) protein/tetratricopeptide (TPR) repeat protein
MSRVDAGRLVRFGTFEFDLDAGVLHRLGRRVPLQEQPASILAFLLSRPGELVTREELKHLVWTGDTFVEFDASLNAAITKIRRALGDSATTPRFVETVPKRGYRFLAEVHGLAGPAAPAGVPTVAVDSLEVDARQAPPNTRRAYKIALIGLAVTAAWLLSAGPRGRSPAPLARSMTVQPFEVHGEEMHSNLGSELAVAIARRLGRLQSLSVKPWPSGITADPRVIGRELGVDARLSGDATRSAQQLSIALRLVSNGDERVLWKDVVDVPVSDLMWLESQIAQRVGAALDVPMSGKERAALARHMTENLEAYQWFLRGRLHFERRTSRDLREAVAAFERATASDPNYALAYAWVANTYSPVGYLAYAPPWETGPAQRAAAEKALVLDPDLAEAHLSLALALGFQERRWADAEASYRRALALDPNYATGHHWYAFFLQTRGRFDEALEERRRALEIDPLTPMLSVGLAGLYWAMRQPDRALDAVERTLERHPRFWYGRLQRGESLAQLGRHREALRDFLEAERAAPDNSQVLAAVVGALVATGEVSEARRRVLEAERRARSTYVSAFDLGLMRISLGDIDAAFDWLQRGCDIKEVGFASIGFHLGVDPIRQDPRFRELLACAGLPQPSRPPARRRRTTDMRGFRSAHVSHRLPPTKTPEDTVSLVRGMSPRPLKERGPWRRRANADAG